MLIIEALSALQFLKKELINLSDLGEILGLGRAAMSGRVQRKSVLKAEEISKIEQFYNVDLVSFVEKMKEINKTTNDVSKEELKGIIMEVLKDAQNKGMI